jgi:uncharacterized phosphosugar-binding protein
MLFDGLHLTSEAGVESEVKWITCLHSHQRLPKEICGRGGGLASHKVILHGGQLQTLILTTFVAL